MWIVLMIISQQRNNIIFDINPFICIILHTNAAYSAYQDLSSNGKTYLGHVDSSHTTVTTVFLA